jgi:hypothetical protein
MSDFTGKPESVGISPPGQVMTFRYDSIEYDVYFKWAGNFKGGEKVYDAVDKVPHRHLK